MSAEPGQGFRWGIVVRRSRLNEDGTEGSTRRQEHAVHQHIKANGMGVVVAVYSDIASAYDETAKRPEFEAALVDLKAGRIDGIAVWKIDRLVRRTSQYRRMLDILEASGGRLFSLTEGIDTAAEGVAKVVTNIVLSILVALAEMESDSTSARTTLMHEDRARQGLVQRNQVRPYGHNDDWTLLVPHEVERIQEAARRVLAGESVSAITRDWTKRGFPTARGKSYWHHSVLSEILASPRMVGMRDYGGALFDLVEVPPILEHETWERVCNALTTRRFQTGRKESRLLSNVAVCARCGRTLVGNIRSTNGQAIYNCRKRPSEPDACGSIVVVGEGLDAHVGEEVIGFLNDRQRVAVLLRQHAKGPEMEALHQRTQELSDSLLALDSALNPPTGMPRMPLPRYWQQVEVIEDERREIHRRMALTREASLLAETLDFGEGDAAEAWAERSIEWKRSILRLVTERIEVGPEPRGRPRAGQYGNQFNTDRVKIKFAA